MPINLRPTIHRAPAANTKLPLYFGFVAGLIFFLLSGLNSLRNTISLREGAAQVERAHAVIRSLGNVLSLMKDAETGQRGFLITGDESYLKPFHEARTQISAEVSRMGSLTMDNPEQRNRIPDIEAQVQAKFAELDETIGLRRDVGFDAARAVVITDRGKQIMDALRANFVEMEREEKRLMRIRTAGMHTDHTSALAGALITASLGIALLFAVTWLIRRANNLRIHQEWSQNGRLELGAMMSGDKTLEPLAQGILTFLAGYLNAQAGVIYASRGGRFERLALVGVHADGEIPMNFMAGEGLLGRAVAERVMQHVDDVPEGYMMIGSGLGHAPPRHLLILPALVDKSANAVVELGFVQPVNSQKQEFLRQVSELIGVAVKSALYREELHDLLSETQQQAEELQAQSEELRISNEGLEQKSGALEKSEARLRVQQSEMEEVNTQLEEQTLVLERQKGDLLIAKENLESKAHEVEQASRYKSDFLANMSHELRTPLNSLLILSKLLAENPQSNLTEEQVKFAKTIESAGEDLLTLINDVLDLSKIEAGHMEVNSETVRIQQLLAGIRDTFAPVSSQRSLELVVEADESAPAEIETDPYRLMQVLKNLLSNATKFTETGSVTMRVSAAPDDHVAIAVTDTGIGIEKDKQREIFDPFLQADGTTARKYGGTGLGLSISQKLVTILGGEIRLVSEPGKGSTFTVIIPRIYQGPAVHPASPHSTVELRDPPQAPDAAIPLRTRFHDDRGSLTSSGRLILAVEDDDSFARIVYDLCHEMHFQCLVATTAEEAQALAVEFLPSAIVLDVRLPDNSGLLVLERLKVDSRTRHIPVHVVSSGDYMKTALALGAVGYLSKPVKREQLAEAFQALETRFTRRMRRVLVVEDDAVHSEALRELLGSGDVEAVCTRTAADCLAKLSTMTFDCMVLDLSLPDGSGLELLETLSADDSYSFPPVIVYTGRELTKDEEQRLRRYSKSIIIKGAKSPERLLDEVTLFLHQVVSDLPVETQRMIENSNARDAALEGRCILVVEDDVRNIFAIISLLERRGVKVRIARNGLEAISALELSLSQPSMQVDMVLMDIMMPEMDGLTAMNEIRKRPEWGKLPIIALTAKAMKSDQEQCLAAGASDFLSKPLEIDKLLSLIRVWMPR